jgi:glutathione peroxidase
MRPSLIVVLALIMQSLLASAGSLHETAVRNIDGKETSLEAYRGKVLLIVNVASKCGFTPQYKELESVYEKYKDKGFVFSASPVTSSAGKNLELTRKSNSSARASTTLLFLCLTRST